MVHFAVFPQLWRSLGNEVRKVSILYGVAGCHQIQYYVLTVFRRMTTQDLGTSACLKQNMNGRKQGMRIMWEHNRLFCGHTKVPLLMTGVFVRTARTRCWAPMESGTFPCMIMGRSTFRLLPGTAWYEGSPQCRPRGAASRPPAWRGYPRTYVHERRGNQGGGWIFYSQVLL